MVRKTLEAGGKIGGRCRLSRAESKNYEGTPRNGVGDDLRTAFCSQFARTKWVQINSLLHQRRAIGAEVTGASGILESGSEPEAFILGQELADRQVMCTVAGEGEPNHTVDEIERTGTQIQGIVSIAQ